MDIKAIIEYLDNYLDRSGLSGITPPEANALLQKAGLLKDSRDRPGKPLRNLLRQGKLPHAYQSGGKGSEWTIPHSSKRVISSGDDSKDGLKTSRKIKVSLATAPEESFLSKLKHKLENSRLKYRPQVIKYLLIAEAPPENFDRFFYFEDVRNYDYLFLGVAEALFPELKDKYLARGRDESIKTSILRKMQGEGFYLLDVSDLPLPLIEYDLSSQLPGLITKISDVINPDTKIILIKATVYDTAYDTLKQHWFHNVINRRIPFPGQGGQRLFQTEFREALKEAKYFD